MNNNLLIVLMVFFFLISFTHADYLNTSTTNQCIYNVQPYQNNKGLCYTKRSNNLNYCSTALRYSKLIDGYVYLNGGCYLKNDLRLTGLTQSEWDYLFSVLAHVLGFTMFFLVNFTVIQVVRSAS